MYTISDTIKTQTFKNLQVQKIAKSEDFEILSISLEKDSIFPEHTSPTDAQLVVLEGDIVFHINNLEYKLSKQQHFNFPKEVTHWVTAKENAKFLIIR